MRYLETLTGDEQVGKVILVAGFTDSIGFKELENFFDRPLDFSAVKHRSKRGFVAIQSDNDQYVSEQYGVRLRDELDAKLVIKHGAYHMSGDVDGEDSYLELPEVIQSLN